MIILGIETSCDETAVSLLHVTENRAEKKELLFKVLNNSVLSQIKLHEQYGGVFPIMAKREHARNLAPLTAKVLKEAGFLPDIKETKTAELDPEKKASIELLLSAKEKELLEILLQIPELWHMPHGSIDGVKQKIDAVAVTQGPGLEPALWVGINFAKALHILWGVRVIPVNHMEGHIIASLLNNESTDEYRALRTLEFPALALLVSGGHTELVSVTDHRHYTIIGRTRDDAVGEAFDKVARLLGLPYPGGPQISRLAEIEREQYPEARKKYILPRPMIASKDFDFSFSGIKTAVLYMTREIMKGDGSGGKENVATQLTDDIKQQIAREFEDAVTEVLVFKTRKAIEETGARSLIIGGGVVANKHIRQQFTQLAGEYSIPLLLPSAQLSTDNALMIAVAGALSYINEKPEDMTFKADGNLALSEFVTKGS